MNKQKACAQNPCVRNCCLDDEDVCIGCGRTLEQICQWQSYSKDKQKAIFTQLQNKKNAGKTSQS
ncbi:DUF1289 domain-containing protein [Catenovulum sp. SM1970]|uniref:DUF1289 domain-containing protein n=1 Tax=Marinifaba aquimaris TaxID=2741323 RepID=UPI00157377CB|nr:DUF1289 domain-containing protein [Marinifaba aquimaris]NTS76939.1 DUF1289 domain-containing protein [Marinifaba aquimaris]